MDRSFLGLYRAGLRREVPSLQHLSPDLLLRFGTKQSSSEPWLYTVQGVPTSEWEGFRDFVASYRVKAHGGEQWTFSWEPQTMLDPFQAIGNLSVEVLVPKSLRTGRTFRTKQFSRVFPSPGVQLQVAQELT